MTPAARAVLEDVAIEQGLHAAFMRAWQHDWGFDVDALADTDTDALAFAERDALADAALATVPLAPPTP